MTVMRRLITLTLIGMVAAFIFPVCVNAQEAPTLTPVADGYYTAAPTLTWVCESGPTKFTVSINGTSVDVGAGLGGDGKWIANDRACVEDAEVADKMNCTHTYEQPAAIPVAGSSVTWSVTGTREVSLTSTPDDNEGGDATYGPSTEDEYFNLGDVLLSIATDVADGESVVPGDTVTATVSLDNQTNGSIPLNSLKFAVDFIDAAFTAPAEVILLGAVSSITPVFTSDPGKLSFEFDGEIDAGSGAIVTIPFTVNADAALVAHTFTLSGNEAKSTSIPFDPDNLDTLNPSAVGDPASVTVEAAVAMGDVGGAEGLDLADAILPLQVAAGMPDIIVNVKADVNEDGKIGVVESAYVLRELAK